MSWNGGPPANGGGGGDPDKLTATALAATALAAYTTGLPPTAAAEQPPYGAAYPSQAHQAQVIYQAQALEALRRQEEIRHHQAYSMAIQQAQSSQQQQHAYAPTTSHDDDDDDDEEEEEPTEEEEPSFAAPATAVATAVVASKELRVSHEDSSSDEEDQDEANPDTDALEMVAVPIIAPTTAEAELSDVEQEAEVIIVEEAPTTPVFAKKKKATPKKKASTKKKSSPAARAQGPSIEDPSPPITEEEYDNVELLMMQFCRVPLLAEFSRPVSLLHPELMSVYSKIVKHPMDLGRVCRSIRRRSYKDTRSIRMDMWRIFSNCIKYHTHPSNRDNAVPAFISISLHLRDYFNALWQEFMMPSDMPISLMAGKQPRGSPAAVQRAAFDQRDTDRLQRLTGTGTTILSNKCIEKLRVAIDEFIQNGGCVDALDKEAVIGEDAEDDDDEGDLDICVDNLKQFQQRLKDIGSPEHEYTVDEMVRDMKRCYNVDLFENRPSMRIRISNRLDRMLGKIMVPIYETSCRGVNQSSIWGCMAAAIWARESSKKPYWPALVLGIMAPECQRENWHSELTARNEARLPEKLLTELQTGKRKAEQSLKRDTRLGPQQLSYFLVEFMGTHEFIWVKEGDIIETFDPEEDPNVSSAAGNITKKKRSSRNIADSKTFVAAIEEGRWALEEFELQLSDACGDQAEDEDADDEQEMNYSYAVLGQSDDEADEEEDEGDDDRDMTASDIEEANEMLAADGLIDYSAEGRKNARKRSLARKKDKANAEKAAAKKEKNDQLKKAKDKKSRVQKDTTDRKKKDKQRKDEKKDLEDRRKKRKATKEKTSKSKKKRRIDTSDDPLGKLAYKRGRATAIVNGYLTRILKKEEMKNLCLAGVLNIPASVVDSSGLLGMALAFRAAAGEVPMPEDAQSKFEPWKQIDVDGPKTSAERTKNLEKQLDLLQKKLEEVKYATAKRKEMTQVAVAQKLRLDEEILLEEKGAKKEIMSRALKKKPVVKQVDPKQHEVVLLEGTVVDGDANDGIVVEVVADAVVDGKPDEDVAMAEVEEVEATNADEEEEVAAAEVEEEEDQMEEVPVEAVVESE